MSSPAKSISRLLKPEGSRLTSRGFDIMSAKSMDHFDVENQETWSFNQFSPDCVVSFALIPQLWWAVFALMDFKKHGIRQASSGVVVTVEEVLNSCRIKPVQA